MSHRASFLPFVVGLGKIFGAVGLASIFNYYQIVFIGQIHDRIHVCSLSIEVHRDDGRDAKFGRALDQLAGIAIDLASSFDVILKFLWIQRVGGLVDVHKGDLGPGLRNALRSGDESVRSSDYDIANANARSHKSEAKRVSST